MDFSNRDMHPPEGLRSCPISRSLLWRSVEPRGRFSARASEMRRDVRVAPARRSLPGFSSFQSEPISILLFAKEDRAKQCAQLPVLTIPEKLELLNF